MKEVLTHSAGRVSFGNLLKRTRTMLLKEGIGKPLFILVVLLFFFFGILYVLFGSSNYFDGAGHIALAWNIKNNLWPDFSGWNPYELMGIQQGLFYPPLFHYLLALLMFILPPVFAGNILIAAILFSFPFACYYFSRQLFFGTKNAASYTYGLSLVLLLCWFLIDIFAISPVNAPGAGPVSTFAVGLLPSFFVVPLLFLFFGSVIKTLREEREQKKQNGLFSGVLLAVVLLSHFTGIVAIFAMFFSLALPQKKTERLVKIKILLVGLLLSAFWWIPLVANSGLLLQVSFPTTITAVIIFLPLIALGISFFVKDSFSKITGLTIALIGSCIIAGQVFALPFQIFRLYPFMILLFPIPLLYYINEKKADFLVPWIAIAAFISIGLLAPHMFSLPAQNDFAAVTNQELDGKLLVLSESSHNAFYHGLIESISEQTDAENIGGLFVESSPVSSELFTLERYVQSSFICWGMPCPNQKRYDPLLFAKRMDAFNVQYIVADSDDQLYRIHSVVDSTLFGAYTKKAYALSPLFVPSVTQSSVRPLYLYTLVPKSPVELPKEVRIVTPSSEKEWQNIAATWFNSTDATILVRSDSNRTITYDPLATVSDYQESPTKQSFSFVVHAAQEVPILVKQNWSPNWSAVDEAGHELTVYAATPYSLLVFGKGKITFINKLTLIEITARLISAIVLFCCGVVFLRTRRRDTMHKGNVQKKKLQMRELLLFVLMGIVFVGLVWMYTGKQVPSWNAPLTDTTVTSEFDLNYADMPLYAYNSSGDVVCYYPQSYELMVLGDTVLFSNGTQGYYYSAKDSIEINDITVSPSVDKNAAQFFEAIGEPVWCQLHAAEQNNFYQKALTFVQAHNTKK